MATTVHHDPRPTLKRGPTRRQVLKFSAAAALIGLTGAGMTWCHHGGNYPQAGQLEHLDGHQAAVLEQLAQVFIGPGTAERPGPEDLPVSSGVDGMLAPLAPKLRDDFLLGITGFDYGAIVLGWHGQRFLELEPTDATAYVQRWFDGAPVQRALIGNLRQLVLVNYWRQRPSWPATGYLGPLHERAAIPRYGNAPRPA